MSNIDTAIYTRLSTHAGLAALVSTRIYPPPAPQDATYPLVTYQQISGIREYAMTTQVGLVDGRFQFDVWAETRPGARTVAEQVRQALSNYRGTSDTIQVDFVRMDTELVDYDEDAALHRVLQDYIISYRETAIP